MSRASALNRVDESGGHPDWDKVPFDVGCARCGADLRGLDESVCPSCGFGFDWADAVPIEHLTCQGCDYHLYGLVETRCPECGLGFTWDAVLTEYHGRQKPLFEYRWRDEPIRSLVRTWMRTLRPRRFWNTIDIHDPPQVGPLLVFALMGAVLFLFCMIVFQGIDNWIWASAGRGWQQVRPVTYDLGSLFLYVISAFFSPELWSYFVCVVVWFTLSFASLMLFPQSMRLCRVRGAQVLRVWAYSVPPIIPLVTVLLFLYSISVALLGGSYIMETDGAAAVVVLISVTRALHVGYRRYLQMPHSWGVAIASQFITALATAVICFVVLGGLGSQLVLEVLRLLHLW